MSDVVVSTVSFSPDGLDVQFMVLPDDVRSGGALIASRSYSIAARHPEYGDDVQDITRAITELVEEVHAGFADEPIAQPEPDTDDDDAGMGS
jgi:hypothetical protein